MFPPRPSFPKRHPAVSLRFVPIFTQVVGEDCCAMFPCRPASAGKAAPCRAGWKASLPGLRVPRREMPVMPKTFQMLPPQVPQTSHRVPSAAELGSPLHSPRTLHCSLRGYAISTERQWPRRLHGERPGRFPDGHMQAFSHFRPQAPGRQQNSAAWEALSAQVPLFSL